MDYRGNGYGYPYMTPYTQAFPDQLSQLRNQQYAATSMNQPTAMPQAGAGNAILWVQGEAGAKSYLVAPGTTVLLMDSEDQIFYIKSTDQAGMPSMRAFEYKERNAEPSRIAVAPVPDYVTRKEFDELKSKIDSLTGSVLTGSRQNAPVKTLRAKGGNDDEPSV